MQSQLIQLQKKGDERGNLIVLENTKEIPFEVKRLYYIFDTKADVRRGFHAHYKLHQMAMCLRGSCVYLMDDGHHVEFISLNDNHTGLFIPPLVWHEMFDFSEDCVLLVLADDYYDENDYIRNYQKFISIINGLEDENTAE